MQKMMSELLDFGSDMRFMEEELDQFGAELDALCLGKEAPAKKPIENEKEGISFSNHHFFSQMTKAGQRR